MAFSSGTTVQGDLSNDATMDNPPQDSISELAWSPISNHLAVASWDNSVRIYDVSNSVKGEGKALFSFPSPALSCAWSPDGSKIVGAGADGSARLMDLASGQLNSAQQVAQHDSPVSVVRLTQIPNSQSPIVVTGSWDRKVKYWDLRQSVPIGTLECPERVYSMGIQGNQLLVAMADCHLGLVNIHEQPTAFAKALQSPLKKQTRTVCWIPDGSGFGVGSIEGRCGISYVDESKKNLNFTFRCHRNSKENDPKSQLIYAVNAISFHPRYYTFSTAGSDGTFCFWDKDAHQRLKAFPAVGGSITSTAFNGDGSIFAYAVGYDWSKGYAHNTPDGLNQIRLHPVSDAECKPKGNPIRR
ncbi:WD40 [Aspergillus sclerotialis]|uniref:WD40 repeat protein poxJ n=1 Tax=Aspergillus sclerotialis TaxID=2070753 RepID=A0A3A2ZVG1_9EURO|nr:WD40 [Aspergillus sclerotialis]